MVSSHNVMLCCLIRLCHTYCYNLHILCPLNSPYRVKGILQCSSITSFCKPHPALVPGCLITWIASIVQRLGFANGLETDILTLKGFERNRLWLQHSLGFGMVCEPLAWKTSSPQGNSTCFIQHRHSPGASEHALEWNEGCRMMQHR